jgi:hypothetical protein
VSEPTTAELIHRIDEVREDVRDLKADMAKRMDAVVIAAVHERDYQYVRAEIAQQKARIDAMEEGQRWWRRLLIGAIVTPVFAAVVSALVIIAAVGP